MDKKLGIGIAAATLAAGLVYLYRKGRARKKMSAPEAPRSRHRTDVFSRAKPISTPAIM